MVSHIGINPKDGWCSIYNENNKTTEKKFVGKIEPNDIDEVDEMFKKIKGKINGGKIGCTCIYLPWGYKNEIRKIFIESGNQQDSTKIQIANGNTVDYLDYSFHAECNPNPGDIIWIFTHNNICAIWEKTETKAKILDIYKINLISTEDDLLKIKKRLRTDRDPNIIITNKLYNPNVNLNIVKKVFPNGKLLVYEKERSASEGALLKARIMAKNSKVLEYDTDHQLEMDMTVKINDKEYMVFKWLEFLPAEKIAIIPIHSGEILLKVFAHYRKIDEEEIEIFSEEIKVTFDMLKAGEILFTFKIDENEICSTQIEISESKEIKYLKEFYSTNFKRIYNIPQKFLINNSNINAVGIDLGTSRCCAAVNRRNGIETVVLDNTGERQLPSYVAFDEENEKCGKLVVDRLQNYAKYTVFDSKRIIGRNLDEIKIDENWPFEVLENKDKVKIQLQRCNNEVTKAPEEIAAILLKHIKQKVEQFQGKEMDEVVITVPAAFTRDQKFSTHMAANFAGWKDIHFLPEPIAASISYFIDREIPDNSNVLLFDLGGGTLDVCIFKIANKNLGIISNVGDINMGGRNFDQLLIEYFEKILSDEYGIDVIKKEKRKYQLMEKCIDIKHTLSALDEASLDVNDFNTNMDGMLKITRQEYETMAKNLLDKIKLVIVESLKMANMQAIKIDKVLFAGGACRMPMIQKLLQDTFPHAEPCCEVNPDEVVATGAAYYAYYLQEQKGARCSVI